MERKTLTHGWPTENIATIGFTTLAENCLALMTLTGSDGAIITQTPQHVKRSICTPKARTESAHQHTGHAQRTCAEQDKIMETHYFEEGLVV